MAAVATYNQVWIHILHELKYNDEDEFIITADEIKKTKETWKGQNNQFEPRLLCKMDSESCRPKCFIYKGLFILAIENGKYLLSKINSYHKLTFDTNKIPILIEKDKDCILLSIGNSETSMIDNLYYSSVLDNVMGEPILYAGLLGGRHRLTTSFFLNGKSISIKGVQYETDSAYESKNKILIIEAKNLLCDSFNIRQLYFPFKSVYDALLAKGCKKEILCAFILGDKKQIHIWTFTFTNPEEMSSIKECDYNIYKFSDAK